MRWSLLTENPLSRSILDFIFPPLCLGCARYFDEPGGICHRCEHRLEVFESPICAGCGAFMTPSERCPECGPDYWPLFAYGNYRPPLKDIILQFKFKGITSPADWVAPRLAATFAPDLAARDAHALVPIPLHPSRLHRRGYNQAKVFADSLSRVFNIPVIGSLLIRTRRRPPQSRVNHRHRERNVQGVFAVSPAELDPGNLILVDDVVTTGATIREARRVLRGTGYRVVGAIAMAHGV